MTYKTAKPGELLGRFPEINFSNYGQQEVEALQAWALEAFDALSATLSPTHIEEGEEVEVVGSAWRNIYNNGFDHVGPFPPSLGGPVVDEPQMTVAQHQRIVCARASKAAARVEDEREACELWIRQRSGMPAHIPMDWDVPFNRHTWAAWSARAALSAPPAAVVDRDAIHLAFEHKLREVNLPSYGENRGDWRRLSREETADVVVELLKSAAAAPPASEQRTAEELRVLREYRDACIGFNNSLGAETETTEDALQLERQAEARLEAAESACHAFYAAPIPPASEQQRAVGLDVIDKLRLELLPEYEAGYTAIAYGDSDQPVARADGMTAREAIAELLRLNPHLANSEGV